MEEQKSFLIDLAETIDRHLPKRDDREQRSSVLSRGTSHPVLRWLMPNFGTLLLVAVLILTQNVWARQTAGPASPGPSATTVNYQGRLANSDGTPLTEEGVAMSFAIYDAKEDGNLIWPADGEEDHVVDVSDGLFSVPLGSETSGGIPTTTWNGDRYLEITVGGETLEPRELIRSVPIAGMALTVPDGSITSDKLDFRVPQLLGYKTYDGTNEPTESDLLGWHAVKGINEQDILEVTVTTHGAPVMVQMTARYYTVPNGDHWCSINVYQGETYIRRAMLDGNGPSRESEKYGCSGGYLFTDLPAGTYTFRAMAFVRPTADVQWQRQRQIVVFEYESQ